MNILILKSTVADGQSVQAGQAVDVSEADARVLVRMGKAIMVVDVADVAAPEALDAPVVEQTRRGRRGNK